MSSLFKGHLCWKKVQNGTSKGAISDTPSFTQILLCTYVPIFLCKKGKKLTFWFEYQLPVVIFINVKSTNFLYKRCVLAAFSSYMYVKKRRSYEKFVRKILMKLTPGCNPIDRDWNLRCRYTSSWAQFHQRSTYSFYARRSRKRKKILMTWLYFLRFWDLRA